MSFVANDVNDLKQVLAGSCRALLDRVKLSRRCHRIGRSQHRVQQNGNFKLPTQTILVRKSNLSIGYLWQQPGGHCRLPMELQPFLSGETQLPVYPLVLYKLAIELGHRQLYRML